LKRERRGWPLDDMEELGKVARHNEHALDEVASVKKSLQDIFKMVQR